MVHYRDLIKLYGAPNGLCSSITESRHITAVKRPYRRSNRFNALGQMLLTNERLDKLEASRVYYNSQGMLKHHFLADTDLGLATEIDTSTALSGKDEDDAILDEPTTVGRVELAHTPREFKLVYIC